LVLVAHTLPGADRFVPISVVAGFAAVLGVDIFFALSGFLIGGIILREKTMGPAKFLIRRWFRTIPLFWACPRLSS